MTTSMPPTKPLPPVAFPSTPGARSERDRSSRFKGLAHATVVLRRALEVPRGAYPLGNFKTFLVGDGNDALD